MSNQKRSAFSLAVSRVGGASLMAATLITVGLTTGVAHGWAQEPAQPEAKPEVRIDWKEGPTTGKLGDVADIDIPEGYRFADKAGAEKVLQVTQNLPSGRELGAIVAQDAYWFMIFE